MPFHVSHEVTPTRDKADFPTERAKNCTNWLSPANLTLVHGWQSSTASVRGKMHLYCPNLQEDGLEFKLRLGSEVWTLERKPCAWVCPCRVDKRLFPSPVTREGGCSRAVCALLLRLRPPAEWAVGRCSHPSPCLFLSHFLWSWNTFPSWCTWPQSLQSASPLVPSQKNSGFARERVKENQSCSTLSKAGVAPLWWECCRWVRRAASSSCSPAVNDTLNVF